MLVLTDLALCIDPLLGQHFLNCYSDHKVIIKIKPKWSKSRIYVEEDIFIYLAMFLYNVVLWMHAKRSCGHISNGRIDMIVKKGSITLSIQHQWISTSSVHIPHPQHDIC